MTGFCVRPRGTSLHTIGCLVALSTILAGCSDTTDRPGEQRPGNSHQDHDDHGDHGEAGIIRIGTAERAEFGIVTAVAGPAAIATATRLPGELALNSDNVAHVAPRVTGVTRSVRKSVGDTVREGELLAMLDSRELAQAKAHYLAALAGQRIAGANFAREEKLWHAKINSERAFLAARESMETTKISRTLAESELHALGLTEADVASLPDEDETAYTAYRLTAPISGTVIERHIVRGEVIRNDGHEPTFVIADLSSVWLNLTVYPDDLGRIRPGLGIAVELPSEETPRQGIIQYVTPLVDTSTRTATARVVLSNPNGTLRPGLFVTAHLVSDARQAPVAVQNGAIQVLDDKPTVFAEDGEGFVPLSVTIGASDATHTEILTGLAAGRAYVARGGFVLKSHLQKSELEHAGHAH